LQRASASRQPLLVISSPIRWTHPCDDHGQEQDRNDPRSTIQNDHRDGSPFTRTSRSGDRGSRRCGVRRRLTFGITGDEGGDHISSIGYGRPRQRFVDYREAGRVSNKRRYEHQRGGYRSNRVYAGRSRLIKQRLVVMPKLFIRHIELSLDQTVSLTGGSASRREPNGVIIIRPTSPKTHAADDLDLVANTFKGFSKSSKYSWLIKQLCAVVV